MKDGAYAGLWWSTRLYVLLFAGFIAAFGAFGWRVPAARSLRSTTARASSGRWM